MLAMAERAVGVELPHLKAWRIRRLLKQTELAEAAGVSRFTIVKGEHGERVSLDVVKKLAQALGVSTDDLRFREPGGSASAG